eukprot:2013820-Amphidinium_carterae.1
MWQAGSLQRALDEVTGPWKELWASHPWELEPLHSEHLLPPLTQQQITDAVRRMAKNKATGADCWQAPAWGPLEREFHQALADILNAIERTQRWPTTLLTMIILIPKPGGGERPIGLLPALHRLWAHCRKSIARRWLIEMAPSSVFGVGDRSCVHAAYQRQLVAELARSRGQAVCDLFLDVAKFYEHLQHDLLMHAARRFGFCPHLVICAIQAYRGWRVMQLEGLTTQPFRVHVSVTAGCPLATALAALFMCSLHIKMAEQHPTVGLVGVVDDLQMQQAGEMQTVRLSMTRAECTVREWLTQHALPLCASKCNFMAAPSRLQRHMEGVWTPLGYQCVSQHKNLGAQSSCARRRATKVTTRRVRTAGLWMQRCRRLRQAGAK